MTDYKAKIYEKRCFVVFTEKMLEFMKERYNDKSLELRITVEPLEICIYDNKGELRYDEDHMIECMSDELGIEINNMFFDGNEFGGVLYFTERKLE